MEIKILGVCSSPVKRGNTEVFLEEALKAAREIEGVGIELVTLRGMDIHDCVHCNWCLTKQEEGRYCAQRDDMDLLYPKIYNADGLLLATPVYFSRMTGYLAAMIDRLRVFMFGNYYRGKLKDKVGGGLAVGWMRHSGVETTLLSLVSTFLYCGMIPAGVHGAAFGAAGVSSLEGTGKFIPDDKHLVLKDEYGLKSARIIAQRMVELIRIIKLGKEAQFRV